ncbi:Acetolactate synthase small subunit, mitochondrial [Vanrija pseudolonga]|uniref:Acetolactate synthase small subunit, mitochondrial n=1 Tax=Vanrija pseudolonga TaxID=143232 RepID=A0AAF1BI79_9TREE|nr:Acetolactate synthase small subunit, mitochondrial [Vanrija pseudolonga]
MSLSASLRQQARPLARALSTSATARSGNKPKPIDDSTSALNYKMHRPSARLPHLATAVPRAPSAEDAVTNILYNTPAPSTEPFKRHLLNCLVQNEPGVLSRVSGILAGRGFNIDSLVVCQTEIRDLSRMSIVLKGQDAVIEQARRQLEDLVPVWAVLDYTNTSVIERELLLAKISILGPEFAQQQLTPGAVSSDPIDQLQQREEALARQFEHSGERDSLPAGVPQPELYPSRPRGAASPSELLIAKNLHLAAIKTLADQFGGRVVDVAESSCTVELTAKSSRVEAFLGLVSPFGVLEAARSGTMLLPRTPVARWTEEDEVTAVAESLDASLLPPG